MKGGLGCPPPDKLIFLCLCEYMMLGLYIDILHADILHVCIDILHADILYVCIAYCLLTYCMLACCICMFALT